MNATSPIERSLFKSIHISANGLSVQRTRMNIVSENLANIDTTRTEDGTPYRRKIVQVAEDKREEKFSEVFRKNRIEMENTSDKHIPAKPFREYPDKAEPTFGVLVSKIAEDPSEFRMVYDPAHPDANSEGYVAMPNINPVKEMIELITASRAFEANVSAINGSKEMIRNALKI